MFVVVKTALKQLLQLLCQENCNVNAVDSYGLTPVLHLMNASYNMISANASNVTFCKTILPFVGDMLQHFLKRGLDANVSLKYWTRRMDEAIESTYFKEVIVFLNIQVQDDPQFYDGVRHLLIKYIQRGGNPNLLTFTPSYGTPFKLSANGGGEIPRDASLSCLLTRALYIQSLTTLPPVLEVLGLFYKALQQHKLVELLDSVMHYMSTDFKAAQLPEAAEVYIQHMASTPRSLRQLCRITLASQVGWRLTKKIPRLPLPKMMLNYVINFEM